MSIKDLDKNTKSKTLNLPPEIFIETSVHLALLKGKHISKTINDELHKFQIKGTSTYVKLEYGNNILTFVTYCLNKLRKFNNLEKLRYHITNRLRPDLSKRHLKYQTWFSNVLSKHFNEPEATERAILTLENLLLEGTERVTNICDIIVDEIKCLWTDQYDKWKTPKNCDKMNNRCEIALFFQKNRKMFLKIKEVIENTSEEEKTDQLRGFTEVINQVLNNPKVLKNYKVCSKLADVIIAIQSKQKNQEFNSFFTQNIKESQILCKPLKQLLLYLNPDIDKKIEYYDFR